MINQRREFLVPKFNRSNQSSLWYHNSSISTVTIYTFHHFWFCLLFCSPDCGPPCNQKNCNWIFGNVHSLSGVCFFSWLRQLIDPIETMYLHAKQVLNGYRYCYVGFVRAKSARSFFGSNTSIQRNERKNNESVNRSEWSLISIKYSLWLWLTYNWLSAYQ